MSKNLGFLWGCRFVGSQNVFTNSHTYLKYPKIRSSWEDSFLFSLWNVVKMPQNQVLWAHRTPSNLESGLAGFLTLVNGHGHSLPFLLRNIQMGTINNLSTPKKQGPTTWGFYHLTFSCTKPYHHSPTWPEKLWQRHWGFLSSTSKVDSSSAQVLACLSSLIPLSILRIQQKIVAGYLIRTIGNGARRPEPAQYRPLWHIVFRKSTIVSMNFHTFSLLNSAELSMAT